MLNICWHGKHMAMSQKPLVHLVVVKRRFLVDVFFLRSSLGKHQNYPKKDNEFLTQASFRFVCLAVNHAKTVHCQQRVCRTPSFCSVPFPFCFVFSNNVPNHCTHLSVLLRLSCWPTHSFKNCPKSVVVPIRPSICLSVCSIDRPSTRSSLSGSWLSQVCFFC